MTWIHVEASGHALGVVFFLLMVVGEVEIVHVIQGLNT